MANPLFWKQVLEWIGFIGILLGMVLLIKHYTLDMRLGDMDRGFLGRRTRRAVLYIVILVAGLAVQRLAEHL